MLTSNYYLYCGVILTGLGAFIAIGRWISSSFFGFPPFDSRNPQSGKGGNAALRLQRILSLLAGGLWLAAYFQIYVPALKDIPQYLSGNYSVAEGTVIGADSAPFTIKEDATGKFMEFRWVPQDLPIKEGSRVEVAYLDHSRAASLLKADGVAVEQRRHNGKLLSVILLILSVGIQFSHVAGLLGNREFFQRRRQETLVYTYTYAIALLAVSLWAMSGTTVVVAALCENYNPGMVSVWPWLVHLFHVSAFPLFVLGQQRIAIKGERIFYSSFKKKYKGLVKNIANIELVEKKTRYAESSGIKSIQLRITMADGEVLLVNDMDTCRNRKFYEYLETEVLGE